MWPSPGSYRCDVTELLEASPNDAPQVLATDDPVPEGRGYHVEIAVISFAGLMLEIAYTRVISFKLFYYYTYLVIGLALLGLGAGAVLVAVSARVRGARTDRVLVVASLASAASIAASYLVVAR